MNTYKAEEVKVKEDFDFGVLQAHGYIYSIMEGGYISADHSTIIIETRQPYINCVMCFDGNKEFYNKNVEMLIQLGFVDLGVQGNKN